MSRQPLAERFWAKVDVRGCDECWPWTAGTNEHGYGVINAGGRGRALKAHRLAAELAGKKITGKIVRHTCDNPPCCNPRHLVPGSQADNLADCRARGRAGTVGSRSHLAKLNEEQVGEILLLASTTDITNRELAAIYRVCRTNISAIVNRRSWTHVQPGNAVSSPVAAMLGHALTETLAVAA